MIYIEFGLSQRSGLRSDGDHKSRLLKHNDDICGRHTSPIHVRCPFSERICRWPGGANLFLEWSQLLPGSSFEGNRGWPWQRLQWDIFGIHSTRCIHLLSGGTLLPQGRYATFQRSIRKVHQLEPERNHHLLVSSTWLVWRWFENEFAFWPMHFWLPTQVVRWPQIGCVHFWDGTLSSVRNCHLSRPCVFGEVEGSTGQSNS